ncbi:DUF262 domain-containing protein [Granulosicoccus antarcticus]|uniref:GmrSD restriction endonucleases N-terminal domain-containing protein n=1 Tax=Granulosicoccus antarcticus IMCC3135 TaxID=1192854 RepID=A0A2Z2NY46_9GAMM|nr:DUF262 domain-containing protein [Granulosicoccus antarcticus]ASJ76209.1 hypothetical protein IMCC3135_30800 [Granulosicoccus antarcticus IMCC3135]
MLSEEIESAQRLVRTDAYQMSIGEIVSMYETGEIIIDPEFQRLFRWNSGQKSKLIESLLLGIPIPSIFVFETEAGEWELIDGLQRVSTILEFIGILRSPEREIVAPSVLEATKYLPSLHNAVWEKSPVIDGVEFCDQQELAKSQKLTIRRSRMGVEILKRPSDNNTKYDLFQRLNAGGTLANPQELRNCIMLMVNADYFRVVKELAESEVFKSVIGINEYQFERQKHIEMASRFLVHTCVDYDGKLDVEEYIDEGIVELAEIGDTRKATELVNGTFDLLNSIAGADVLRRRVDGAPIGRVGLVGFEVIAVGVAKNLSNIKNLKNSTEFIEGKINDLWMDERTDSFTSPGLRGTVRISRTIPFGADWFTP